MSVVFGMWFLPGLGDWGCSLADLFIAAVRHEEGLGMTSGRYWDGHKVYDGYIGSAYFSW